jgi:hypothetical protein
MEWRLLLHTQKLERALSTAKSLQTNNVLGPRCFYFRQIRWTTPPACLDLDLSEAEFENYDGQRYYESYKQLYAAASIDLALIAEAETAPCKRCTWPRVG